MRILVRWLGRSSDGSLFSFPTFMRKPRNKGLAGKCLVFTLLAVVLVWLGLFLSGWETAPLRTLEKQIEDHARYRGRHTESTGVLLADVSGSLRTKLSGCAGSA